MRLELPFSLRRRLPAGPPPASPARRSTATSRRAGAGRWAALLVFSAMCALGLTTLQPRPAAALGSSFFGVLETSGKHGLSERVNGVDVGTLDLAWERYQPAPGVFSDVNAPGSYANRQLAKLLELKLSGVRIVLDAGLQYPPAWVSRLDGNARYVDQYGDRWSTGAPGADVPNAVFDASVRSAQATYVGRLSRDLGDSFFAVRAGGGPFNQLRYPDATYKGHRNLYWAFDGAARAQNPVPYWTPGSASPNNEAARFFAWYTSSMRSYQNWLVSTYRSHFGGWIEVLYPSWGLRPGDAAAAVGDNLAGHTPAQINGETSQGNDFASDVASVVDDHTVVYSTWLDAPDFGSGLNAENPMAYLAYLAHQRGLAAAGENTGAPSYEAMALSVQRVGQLGLTGMMWAFEPTLYSGSSPSINDYGALIRGSAWVI